MRGGDVGTKGLSRSVLGHSILQRLRGSTIQTPKIKVSFNTISTSTKGRVIATRTYHTFSAFPRTNICTTLGGLTYDKTGPLKVAVALLLPASTDRGSLHT